MQWVDAVRRGYRLPTGETSNEFWPHRTFHGLHDFLVRLAQAKHERRLGHKRRLRLLGHLQDAERLAVLGTPVADKAGQGRPRSAEAAEEQGNEHAATRTAVTTYGVSASTVSMLCAKTSRPLVATTATFSWTPLKSGVRHSTRILGLLQGQGVAREHG